MKFFLVLFSIINLSGMTSLAQAGESNADIKKVIIAQSIANYPGNCPCPYSTDRAGRRCGKRSAYDRVGGYNTICFPSDITPKMIEEYQGRH